LTFSLKHVLPANLELVWILIVPRLVSRMIDADKATTHICSSEVVDRQVGTSLVLVLKPSETFGLASLFITGQFQPNWFSELRENRNNIAFG
jgi:hypothetical protein